MSKISKPRLHMSGKTLMNRGPATVAADKDVSLADLENLGISVRAMDAALIGPALTTGSIPAFKLQSWLPGMVRYVTVKRSADALFGVTTVGNVYDEKIGVRTAEHTGAAEVYADDANIPLANYIGGVEERRVVRFEQGFQVGWLEGQQQGVWDVDAASEKRRAAQESLDIARNAVAFYGFSDVTNTSIYGALNDPSLPAYRSYADSGSGGVVWRTATFEQITKDIGVMIEALSSQSGGNFDSNSNMVFALPTGYSSIFTRRAADASGDTVKAWMMRAYPNMRIVEVPELKAANGGADVVYLFLEDIAGYDDSDIGGAALLQIVPARYQVVGTQNMVKGYIEDAVNATAGVLVTRPWAVVRYTISV